MQLKTAHFLYLYQITARTKQGGSNKIWWSFWGQLLRSRIALLMVGGVNKTIIPITVSSSITLTWKRQHQKRSRERPCAYECAHAGRQPGRGKTQQPLGGFPLSIQTPIPKSNMWMACAPACFDLDRSSTIAAHKVTMSREGEGNGK